jgi:hypothetical protein
MTLKSWLCYAVIIAAIAFGWYLVAGPVAAGVTLIVGGVIGLIRFFWPE